MADVPDIPVDDLAPASRLALITGLDDWWSGLTLGQRMSISILAERAFPMQAADHLPAVDKGSPDTGTAPVRKAGSDRG